MDNKTYEHDLKDFYFTFIELPKFQKSKEELSSMEEKWCYFFKHAHETNEEDYAALDQFHWTKQSMTQINALTWTTRLF